MPLSAITEKLNNAKPSNMDDEKKETVLRRIKITAAFAGGVLLTAAIAATASYYKSFPETDENDTTTDED